jgi:branched-chain amino acid transport system permease protein
VRGPRAAREALTGTERAVGLVLVAGAVGLLAAMVAGVLRPTYFLFLFGLGGMFALLSLGLNAQWGYTGLINFSVAAFFGAGAYGAALTTAGNSPLAGGLPTLLGLVVALVVAAVVAVAIGLPTLRLRADYFAIATLGLAEVLRTLVRNQRSVTGGNRGLRNIPTFFEGWPLLGELPRTLPTVTFEVVAGSPVALSTSFYQQLLNVVLMLGLLAGGFFVLRRAHRSPWGRVLRTIRADEDLAKALGKDTYRFKLQSFVLGSLLAALAGVFFAHLNQFVGPGTLDPITTFYVWVAVILGGSGSNRGALFGGFVIVAVREGPRFLLGWLVSILESVGRTLSALGSGGLVGRLQRFVAYLIEVIGGLDAAALRLVLVGLLIVVLMRLRPEGVLPPQRELIWPNAVEGTPERPEAAVREARGEADE